MTIKIVRSNERGSAKEDWLESKHSFSFAEYYNPKRMSFGTLRVLNEDWIEPEAGFPMHPHKDFEIVTVILEGSLEHKDSLENEGIIKAGDVQRMSAGLGVVHSEINASKKEACHLYQIWIDTKVKGIEPSYEQKYFEVKKNELLKVVSNKEKSALKINQDAEVSLLELEKGKEITIEINYSMYLQVNKGKIEIENYGFSEGDAAEITNKKEISIRAAEDTKLLLIDVPVK